MLRLKDLGPFKRWIALYYLVLLLGLVAIFSGLLPTWACWSLFILLGLFDVIIQLMVMQWRKKRSEDINSVKEFVGTLK